MTREEFSDLIFEKLNFCGCGDPEEALNLLKQVLEVFNSEENRHDALNAVLDCKDAIYWSYLYWLDGAELIDHNYLISNSWLTDLGKELLEILGREGFNLDDYSIIEDGKRKSTDQI